MRQVTRLGFVVTTVLTIAFVADDQPAFPLKAAPLSKPIPYAMEPDVPWYVLQAWAPGGPPMVLVPPTQCFEVTPPATVFNNPNYPWSCPGFVDTWEGA